MVTLHKAVKNRFTFGKKMSTALLFAGCLGMTSIAGFAHADKSEALIKKNEVVQKQVTTQVNINSANAELLASSLVGVGEAKAKAIVDHRKAHGKFTSVDQLAEVKGIGNSIIEKNRSLIRL